MERTVYRVDDPKLLKKGLDALLKAFVPAGLDRGSNDVSWYIKGAPGAVTDVTERLRGWVRGNAERFRAAHPGGGAFSFRGVAVSTVWNDDRNSENTNTVRVDGFSLSSEGTFLFDTVRSNDYYDVDMRRDKGVTLDEVMSMAERSEGFGTNLYSAFKAIFERADAGFRCEGTFGHLSPGKYNEGWPDSATLEMRNTLSRDVLLPWRKTLERDGFSPVLTLSAPNGNVLGWDDIVDVHMKGDGVMVDDVDDTLGLDENAGRVRAAVLLDRLFGLAFSEDNLEKVAPRYTSYGLPVPSSGRVMNWEDEARRRRSAEAYSRFNAVKTDANGKGMTKR